MNLKRGEVLEVTEGIEVEVLEVSRRDRKMMDEEQGNNNSKSNNISWPLGNPLHQSTPFGMPSSSSSPIPSMSPPMPQIALLGSSRFIWWPSAHQYRVFYRRDLLFFAGFIQFIGTWIFAIASITAVPGVISFENILIVDLSNLGPATLGGVFFLIAAMCQILNAQEHWYAPRPTTLDWQIGLWNAIGSLGFTLAGALPYIGTTNATLQATIADFWGSWAFLIGSLLQLYSSLGNYC
ncbi:hypothetical protein BGZ60DRAFT_420974 [Tricladium varicosporioides]|nr:hypothetical protein BGZ60DRAFT_420974 [Hymenoscyphus varicosporioides]